MVALSQNLGAYQQLEHSSIKSKQDLQRAWEKCRELQEENDILAGTWSSYYF